MTDDYRKDMPPDSLGHQLYRVDMAMKALRDEFAQTLPGRIVWKATEILVRCPLSVPLITAAAGLAVLGTMAPEPHGLPYFIASGCFAAVGVWAATRS